MMDFRPGEHRVVAPRESNVGGWFFSLLGVVLLAACIWVYQFRQDWTAHVYDLVGLSRTVKPEDFAALYQRYGIPPLGTSLAGNFRVNSRLVDLQKEPCDKRAIFQTSLALENLRAMREAAEILNGFADACPESSGERYRASELYYLLGDYEMAVKLSTDLINHRPDAPKPYFVRARSEQDLKRYAAAIDDYATLIRLLPNTKSVVSEVFTRMSDSYEMINQPCEAIGPIQTYIALDSENRSTPPLLKRIATLAAKGSCEQVYAKGIARIPRRSNGVASTRVEINGVEGTFIVDTGASFVTLTPDFARRAKPQKFKSELVEMQTANGTTAATLATVDSVKLDGLSASGVPAIIASGSLGDGVDGLLGMSFLSRFTFAIQDHEIELKAKTLGE